MIDFPHPVIPPDFTSMPDVQVHWDHNAIKAVHPETCLVIGDKGAFDQDYNLIDIDEAAVEAKSQELVVERNWAALRTERDRLLAETDWWVVADRTATDEQLAYRQALRDLPANTTDPANPVWPVKPS
jgi:hypothetical protein